MENDEIELDRIYNIIRPKNFFNDRNLDLNDDCEIDKLYILNRLKEIINCVNSRGYNLISLAAIDGELDLIKHLIKKFKASFTDCTNLFGSSYDPLHLAAKFGHYDLVTYLVSLNCNIDSLDILKRPAIYYAIESGHINIYKYLLNCSNNIHLITENLFEVALNSYSPEMINMFIGNLNKQNANKCFPLQKLIMEDSQIPFHKHERFKTFTYLLQKDQIDADWINQNTGITPLTLAIRVGNAKYANMLILNNCDVNKCNLDGFKFKWNNEQFFYTFKLLYFAGFKFNDQFIIDSKEHLKRKATITDNFNNNNYYFGNYEHNNINSLFNNTNNCSINGELSCVCDWYCTFAEWLKKQNSVPMSLKNLCRIVVRRSSQSKLKTLLNSQTLPESLNQFCLLADV